MRQPVIPQNRPCQRASGVRPEQNRPPTDRSAAAALPFRLRGFWEARGGTRLGDDPHQRDLSIAETRLQLEAEKYFKGVTLRLTGDFLYDDLDDDRSVDLESGEGAFDLREASLVFSPSADTDVKLGRQILTWGTGDLVFINDLFPKDCVYTPRFDADRFIDGRRLSFFNTGQGRLTGRNAVVLAGRPADAFEDDEWAARLYRNLGAYEVALYGYDGLLRFPRRPRWRRSHSTQQRAAPAARL